MAKYTSEPFGVKGREDLKRPDKDQFATTYDILSEGPIEGLSNGLASIFVNDVPLIQAQAENILKPRRFKATVTGSNGTITHAQFGEIEALSYQNKTGLSLGVRKVAIEKAGAKGTGIASAAIKTKTVTTSSAYFTTTMLQQCKQSVLPIYLRIAGAGVNGTELRTKITSFNSTTSVTISDEIATAVSNVDIFFDHFCTLTGLSGNDATVTGAPVTSVTNANIQVSSPNTNGLNLSNLFNFKDVDIGFRVGNKLQPLLTPRDSEGTSTLFAPNLQLEQGDLRANIGTSGNLSSSTYNNELDEPSQTFGTSADTVLTAAAMGVTAPSEVDEVHLTFALSQCHALKASSGAKGASFVELQIFFEYSTDGGTTFVSELAFGPSNTDVLNRTTGRSGKHVNHPIAGNSSIPNNGYIKPSSAQFTSFIEEFKIDTREFQPYDTYRIRVRRITDLNFKDGSFQHTNPCALQTVDNIVKDKLSYPYTSYASLSFNAKDFDSKVPTRSYLLKGRKVKVPTNYFTRDETGGAATYKRNVSSGATESTYQTWDGNFRGDDTTFNESSVNFDEVYTDNPVWIFYDILTNKHYGLGQFIDPELIDKYELFRLAKFCDEEVPNGEGGTEPRFTCNVYLAKAQEATAVLRQLASVFRGMAIWADGQLTAISDRPKKPVYTFTKANVKDGIFSYEGTGEKVKVNQVKVTWADPDDSYRQAAEYVEDTEALIGDTKSPRLVRTELLAFGTTSRGQAHRLGKWKLISEQTEKETVSFTSGANVIGLKPGDIVAVQDADRDRASYSGRVTNYNPEAGLTLDETMGTGGAAVNIDAAGGTQPDYTTAETGQVTVFAGEVTLPSSFSQDACLWEHGGTGVGSWLGVRDISGVDNFVLRSGEGLDSVTATSADGIINEIPISQIPEFDGGVHTVCWELDPDNGTHRLWIDGKKYMDDSVTGSGFDGSKWSGGNQGGWLKGQSTASGNYSIAAWPVTAGSSGLRHYFNEAVSTSNDGSSTTNILLDRNVTIPAYSSSFPPQLLLIYPEGGAYLNQDSATIGGASFNKGDLIASITSSTAAANAIDSSTNEPVDVYWSENARIETKTVSGVSTSGATVNNLTVSSAFSSPPTPEVMWSLRIFNSDATEATGTVKEYKIINIKENEGQEYDVVAAEYNINKFDKIERGYSIAPRPNTTFPNPEDEIPAPESIVVKITPSEFADQDSSDANFFVSHDANVTWDFPKNSDGSRYGFVSGFEITHNFKGKFKTERLDTQTQGLVIENVKGGTYEISVRTISSINTFSLENKRSYTFNQLHFTTPTTKGKLVSLKKGGLITAPLSFSNGTFSVGDGSTTYEFTGPDGQVETLGATATSTLSVPNNSGNALGVSSILLDLTSNTKQLRQLVQVVDTTANPTKTYFKRNGESNEGLLTVNGTILIEQYSNKVTGTGTNFDGDYEDGMLVKIPNGSSTTQNTGSTASNTTTITLSGTNSDIKIGQTVTGTITGPAGAGTAAGELSVINISGTTLTVSAPVTVANGVTLTFTPRSFYSRITEIVSDTLMFLEDISPRKYSGVQPQRLEYEPNPLKDAIIATTFSKNGVYTLTENFTEFAVSDNALTLDHISDATIITQSEGIANNDNETTFPTSAAVKDYVDNNAAAGTVDTTGTPANNQIAIFTDSNTLEGDADLTFDGSTLEITNNSVDGTPAIRLTGTENSALASPIIEFNRDSASPADADYLGQIKFNGENDNDQNVLYAKITGKIQDASDTTEDGIIEFMTKKAGANNISARLNSTELQLINGTGLSVAGNATITGNLTVDGTTTTINTADLNVEDKNITLNYHASNDTSSTADGAGITIQDAVDASTDATILWDASNDEFDFSHKITSPSVATTGAITSSGTLSITTNGLSTPQIRFVDSNSLSSSSKITHDNGIMTLTSSNNTAVGEIVFTRSNTSTAIETARFDTSGNFKFGASSTTILDSSKNLQNLESIKLLDSKELLLGTSSDVRLLHNGTDTHILNNTGDLFISNFADDKDNVFRSDDGSGGVETYFLLDGSNNKTQFNRHLKIIDNMQIQVGTGPDWTMKHDGSHTYLQNSTGHVYFQQTADDMDIVFQNDDGSGGVAEYMRLDGGITKTVFSKNFVASDDVKGQFGSDADMSIYHDATNSRIENATGDLNITCTGDDVNITSADDVNIYVQGGEIAAAFRGNSSVSLYNNNSEKLATTSSGIDVTGQIEVGDGHLIGNDGFDNLTLLSSSGEHILIAASEDIYLNTGGSAFNSTGTTRMHIDATNGNVGIGTTSADSRLDVTGGDITVNTTGTGFMNFKYNNGSTGTIGTDGIDLKITANADLQILPTGSVGIGTSSPSYKLSVHHATTNVVGSFTSGDNQVWINLNDDGGGTYGALLGHDSDAGDLFVIADNSVTKRVRVNNSGDINLATGALQINGISVIDTSRNLTNIANITTTGTGIIGGGLDVGTFTSTGTTSLNLKAEAQHDTKLGLFEDNANYGFSLNYDGGTNQFALKRHDNSASGASVLTFTRTDNNATFAGTISSGAITSTGQVNADELVVQNDSTFNGSIDATGQTITSGAITSSGTITSSNGTVTNVMSFSDRGIFGTTSNHPVEIRTNGTEAIRITSAGDVGIGETSPDVRLHVKDTTQELFKLETDQTSGYARFYEGASERLRIGFGSHVFSAIPSATDVGIRSSNNMHFGTDNNIRMTILDANGNVGIGTTSPETKLHIAHGSDTSAAVHITGGHTGRRLKIQSFESNSLTGAGFILNADSSGGAFKFQTTSTDRMIINHLGNVGIGTTSPAGLLHVSSGTSGDAVVIIESDTDNNDENDNPQLQFKQDAGATIAKVGLVGTATNIFTGSLANAAYLGNDEAASVQLYTDATARLTIESGGDVGIGITNPTEKLHVVGNILNSGTITSTGSDHTFYSGASEQSLSVGRNLNERFKIHVNDGNITLTADQDSDSDGSHKFILDREFAGSGANDFIIRKDGAEQFKLDTDAKATFHNEVHIPGTVVHVGDTDTHFGFHGNNLWRVVTGGTERFEVSDSGIIINDGGSAYNFRVESDNNANMLFVDGTNDRVGIGTGSPDGQLDVRGTSISTILARATSGNSQARVMVQNDARAYSFKIHTDDTLQIKDETADTARIKISTGGNVSIGGDPNPGGTTATLSLGPGSNATESLVFAPSTGGVGEFRNTSSSGFFKFTNQNGSTELVRIDSSGKVGIRTNAPTSRLTVKSSSSSSEDSAITVQSNVNTNAIFKVGEKSGDGGRLHMFDGGVEKIAFYTDGTANHISAGNFGIGTSSPDALLEVSNSSGAGTIRISNESNTVAADGDLGIIEFYSGDNSNSGDSVQASLSVIQPTTDNVSGEFVFKTSNAVVSSGALTEKMRITKEGNVGILKSAPLDQLHVTGVIRTQMDGNNAKYIRLFGGNSGNFLDTYGNALFIRPSATTALATIIRTDGTVGMSNTLDISRDLNNAAITSTNSNLFLKDTNALAAENGGAIVFSGIYDSSGNHIGQGPHIKGYKVNANSGDYSFGLKFATRQNGVNAVATALTIDETQQVGIGQTNPDTILHVQHTTDPTIRVQDTDSGMKVDLQSNGSTGFVGTTTNSAFAIRTNNTERIKATNAGVISFNGAYTFPTSDGSANQVLQTDGSGALSFADAGGGTITSASNMSNNRVLTASGSTTINGESNLTFDGSTLALTGDMTITDTSTDPFLKFVTSEREYVIRIDNSDADKFQIRDVTGTATRFTITSGGNVGIGTTSPGVQLDIESSGNNSQLELTATDGTDQSFGLFSATGNNSNGAGFYIQDKTANAIRLKVDSSGKVGIGTSSPSSALDVKYDQGNLLNLYRPNSSTAAASLLDFSFNTANSTEAVYARIRADVETNTDSGQGGDLSFHTANSGSVAEKMRITQEGFVGIGTSSPVDALDVNGKIRTNDRVLSNWYQSTSTYGLQFSNSAGTIQVFKSDDGKLGIGTTSPKSMIHINQSSNNSADLLALGTAVDASTLRIENTDTTAGSYASLFLRAATSDARIAFIRTQANGGDLAIILDTPTAGGGTERMRLKDNGRIGMGTNDPKSKLHILDNGNNSSALLSEGTVVDTATIRVENDNTTVGSYASIYLRADTADSRIAAIKKSSSTNDVDMAFILNDQSAGASVERMRIVGETGNVGIGTTSPSQALHVVGNGFFSGGVTVGDSAADTFVAKGHTHLATLGNNVGIGTTSPSHKLDIVGTNGVEITTEETTDAIALLDSNNSNTKYLSIQGDSGDCNINAPAGSLVLQRAGTQRLTVGTTGVAVNGLLSATTKSFIIDHPTKEGMKLRYGSLEGPENGVYARGRLRGNIIELPEYWTELVHEDSITVNLTPIGKHQKLYVEDIKDNQVIVGNENLLGKEINCFYTVYAERKDVEKFEVEYNE